MITDLFYSSCYDSSHRVDEGVSIPIRFSGNKKLWQEFIEKKVRELPEGAVVVDAFGGSGIISYYVIKVRPDIKVIYNDFDNYLDRVDHIEDLEQVRKDLQKLAGRRTRGQIRKNNDLDKNKISDYRKRNILDYLANRKAKNLYTDENVVFTWLTYGFSARGVLDEDTLFVNGIPVDPINVDKAKEYADVLRPLKTRFDIRNIKTSKRLQRLLNDENVYWILDPPYRDTDSCDYKDSFSQEIEDAVKEIIKTNRVLLFCDSKEVKTYKSYFNKKVRVKNKEKLSFMNNVKRTESCIYSW